MDGRGFGDGVREAGAAGFDAREGGGGDECAFCLFEGGFGGVQEPEVRFYVVQEASVAQHLVRRSGKQIGPWGCAGLVRDALIPVLIHHALVQIREVGYPRPAGVADNNIKTAEFGNRVLDELLNGAATAYIRLEGFEARGGSGVGRVGDLVEFFQ